MGFTGYKIGEFNPRDNLANYKLSKTGFLHKSLFLMKKNPVSNLQFNFSPHHRFTYNPI